MPPSAPVFSPWTFFENALLIVVLAVTALRATFIEITYQSQPNPLLPLPADVISILISTVLICAFCLWLALRLFRAEKDRITSGIGLSVCIFIMTGIAAVFIASHKRDAVTDLVTLAAPLLTLLMLAELFRKPGRIILALWVLLALGVTTTYHCFEQARVDNQSVVEDYEQNPQRILRQIGIEPGTLKHWQFEHRLRSKDVRGFLTTSNSTGSFLLLCLFASFGLWVQTIRHSKFSNQAALIVLYSAAILLLLYGLFLCKSRGAIGAGALCLPAWITCVLWGRYLWPYRKILLIIGVLLAASITGSVTRYGLTHGRLPGPNALLVRWQYWESTARLIADHPWLGAGGGNFTIAYPQYKIPAAPEMVRDPHNFFLSIASGYGLLGAVALTTVLLGPLLKIILRLRSDEEEGRQQFTSSSLLLGSIVLLVTAFIFLWIRPVVTEGTITEPNSAIRRAYYMVYYLFPAGMTVLVLGLLILAGREPIEHCACRRSLLPALGWGLGAVLIHNLIDFAIFETAVLMALSIYLAAILALDEVPSSAPLRCFSVRFLAVLFLAAGFIGFLLIAVIPPVRAGANIQQALRRGDQASHLLEQATGADSLSPQPPWLQGQWALQRYGEKLVKDPMLLEQAADGFQTAAERNPDDYRMRESLSDVYYFRAESVSDPNEKTACFERAYTALQQAWRRFPGSDRIVFKLGNIAEGLGLTTEAAGWYCRAVAIEQAYRRQFQEMYPEYDLFSRLGQQRFEYAQEFIRNHSPFMPEKKNTGPAQDPNTPVP